MPTMTTAAFAVIALDPEVSRHIPKSRWYRKYRKLQDSLLDEFSALYLSVSLRDLPEVSSFVREANNKRYLENLFIHDPDASNLLPQYLQKAGLRLFSNLIVHQQADVPARILHARTIGAADELIADAHLVENFLVVMSCSTKTYEIELSKIAALSRKSGRDVRSFQVEKDGSYVYWPSLDVHLDMESIRGLSDPNYPEKAKQERVQSDQLFGQAVADVRRKHGLRQSDIKGLSERQVRRVETGARPRVSTLNLFAKAHSLSTNDYLNEVAETIQSYR